MELDDDQRARIVVALLTRAERTDLARAIDDWRRDRDVDDKLGELWAALLEAAGEELGEIDLPE